MKKKILYISNVPWDSLYGAGSSLRLHFKALEKKFEKNNIYIDVVCRYGLKEFFSTKKIFFSNLPKFLRIHKAIFCLDNLYEIINFEYKNKKSFYSKCRKKLSDFFNLVAEFYFYIKLYNLNKKNNYDFIHCNSVVTIGFLNRLKRFGFLKNLNTILHVRELLVNSLPLKYKKRLNQINRFICISDDTKHALTKVLSKKKKTCVDVINNPFNPGSFKLSTKIQNKLKKNITYFALAGLVTEGKGVEFVLDSFLKAKLAKSILLVVGYGNDFKKLVKKFKRENNIKFLGEIKNLGLTNFYEKIDFLIRGDKTTGVGRTVFEALYSGCKIILPKYNNDKLDRNLKNFKNEIQYYTPRSKRQLIKLFQSIKRTKNTTKRKKINNLNYYTSSILNVYSKL